MRKKLKYPFFSVELLQKKLKEQENKRELLINRVSTYDLRILEIKELIKERSHD